MHMTPNYDSKNLENAPDMWINEINYIKKKLIEQSQKNDFLNILEWGSGNSTIFFSKFLNEKKIPFNWKAIEHFLPWYDKVIKMIELENLSDNVECVLLNPTDEPDKNIQETLDLNDYINYPLKIDKKFNLILVDGRKRKECLEIASKVVKSGGIVLLHDAEREWFHPSFKFFKDGGKFVISNPSSAARDGIQKLWEGKII